MLFYQQGSKMGLSRQMPPHRGFGHTIIQYQHGGIAGRFNYSRKILVQTCSVVVKTADVN